MPDILVIGTKSQGYREGINNEAIWLYEQAVIIIEEITEIEIADI